MQNATTRSGSEVARKMRAGAKTSSITQHNPLHRAPGPALKPKEASKTLRGHSTRRSITATSTEVLMRCTTATPHTPPCGLQRPQTRSLTSPVNPPACAVLPRLLRCPVAWATEPKQKHITFRCISLTNISVNGHMYTQVEHTGAVKHPEPAEYESTLFEIHAVQHLKMTHLRQEGRFRTMPACQYELRACSPEAFA